MHIDTINLGVFCLYFKWSHVAISKINCIFVLEDCFNISKLLINAALCSISFGCTLYTKVPIYWYLE